MLEQLHTPPEHSAEQRQRWHPYGAGILTVRSASRARESTAPNTGNAWHSSEELERQGLTPSSGRGRDSLLCARDPQQIGHSGAEGFGSWARWKCRRMKEEEESQPCKERDPEPVLLWEPVNLGCFARGHIMGRQRFQG